MCNSIPCPTVAVLSILVRTTLQMRLEADSYSGSGYFVGMQLTLHCGVTQVLAVKIGSMSRDGFVHQWHGEGTTKTAGVVYDTWLDAKIQSIARSNPGF